MRPPPKLTEFWRYPVVTGTALLSIGITIVWWSKVNISPLLETAMIRRGETWRLVTSIFPHVNVLHLVFNLYWLWVFGTLIERTYAHLKTAFLIVLIAFSSGAWEYAVAVGGVGLSGVVYGFFGLLWVLSRSDEQFRDAVDSRTTQLFVGWFFLCIVATVARVMPVGNVAHGVGALVGVLVGLAITIPRKRTLLTTGLALILLLGFWSATVWRPRVNLSGRGGYEEGKWGYAALMANRNQEAVRWFRDAVIYQPNTFQYWGDLGSAYMRLGDNSDGISAYRRAADLGAAEAQFYLGSMYETGDKGLPKDDAQALNWYRKAESRGGPNVLNDLAWAYATSSDPAIHDAAKALELARRAVDLGKDNPVPAHLDTLAEAFYANGDYDSAVKTELQAIAHLSSQNKTYYEKQLSKYQQAVSEKHQRSSK